MIFDGKSICAAAEVRELRGEAPLELTGEGLWVGVLSSGHCLLERTGATGDSGASGDILLGRGELTLRPVLPCHLLALRLTGLAVEQFLRGLLMPRFVDSASCTAAAELMARLCHDFDTEHGTAPEQACVAAYALLCALAHADEEVRPLPPLISEAVIMIRDNYMTLYGIEDLSDHLGVSKCHLVRVFGEAMGISPGKYLTHTRIEAAKLLLAEREYSLDMIANLCGFSGANYLCRVFKRETGVSPAAWRAGEAPAAPVKRLPPRNNEIYL